MNRWLYLFLVITCLSFSYCSEYSKTQDPMPASTVTTTTSAPITTTTSTVTTTTSTLPITTTSSPPASGYTYLALGDSYTIGQSVPETDRWPVQLAGLLKANDVDINQPDIIARTGWTTAELANAITQSRNTKKYSMVSLLIGVNNQYRGQSLSSYRTELAGLLKTAIAFADSIPSHVFMLSIPDWGQTPYGLSGNSGLIAMQIDEFNLVAVQECGKVGVEFIDITKFTRNMINHSSLIASDSLHYSGAMYKTWAEVALPFAKQILK